MKIFRPLSLLLMIVLGCTNVAFCQTSYFVAATGTEYSISYSFNQDASNIGCDILATQAVSTSSMINVMVFENGNTTNCFGWDDNGLYPGNDYLSYAPTDPDVVVVDEYYNSNYYCYALIVYYNGSNVYLEIWQWDDINHYFTQISANSIAYPVSPTAVNIDAGMNGDFVITWDDGGTIYVEGGGFVSGLPTLSGNLATISSPAGENPDIAIHNDGGYNNYVYLTYLNSAHTSVYLHTETIANVMGGTFSTTSALYSTGANQYLYTPRICAASDFTDPSPAHTERNNGWTLVMERYNTNSGDDDIIGFFKPHGSGPNSSPYVFTDGANASYSIGDINGDLNIIPVVAYEHLNNVIVVGWVSGYSNDNYFMATSSLAEIHDLNGTLISSNYMAVATGITGSETVLAIAGRHFRLQLYNWYDGYYLDVYYKMELYTAANLRQAPREREMLSGVFPNPFSSTIHLSIKKPSLLPGDILRIQLIDNTGRILWDEESDFLKLEENVNKFALSVASGTFTLKILDSQNKAFLLQQIIKM